MANFDLPWNPMRLVQRIGRLYRYGQQRRVVVFNLHAPDTLDAHILEIMYARITSVVEDMASLGGEFDERLAEDIVGELSDLLDVEEILENALDAGIERTRERIAEAVERARGAVDMQRELFECVTGYDPREARDELRITGDHARAFVEGMFAELGIEIVEVRHKGLVLEIRLPESVVTELSTRRSRWRVTLDRTWAAARTDIHMLDLDSPLMKLLLRHARSFRFGGRTAGIARLPGWAVLAALLRWQNEQGRRMRQEFAMITIKDNGDAELNPESVAEWLKRPCTDLDALPAELAARDWLTEAQRALDSRLAEVSNADLHPENREWVAAGWRAEIGQEGIKRA